MKIIKVQFVFIEEDDNVIDVKHMLKRDNEDGSEFGFKIHGVKIKNITNAQLVYYYRNRKKCIQSAVKNMKEYKIVNAKKVKSYQKNYSKTYRKEHKGERIVEHRKWYKKNKERILKERKDNYKKVKENEHKKNNKDKHNKKK